MASIDTLDVGLSKEEDIVNNVGAREEVTSDYKNGAHNIAKQPNASSDQNISTVEDRYVGENAGKRKLTDKDEPQNSKQARLDLTESTSPEEKKVEPAAIHRRILNRPKSAVNGVYSMAVARPVSSMKGHTAFLTFAVRPLQ